MVQPIGNGNWMGGREVFQRSMMVGSESVMVATSLAVAAIGKSGD